MVGDIESEPGSEPVGLMFCLDCMYKHSRDLEHHLEDAVRVTKDKERNEFEDMIDTMREIRKKILEKIKAAPEESCSTCSAGNPVQYDEESIVIRALPGMTEEEMEELRDYFEKLYEGVRKRKRRKNNPTVCPAGMEKTNHFCRETIAPMREFDPKSIRTVTRDAHRVVIGCPKGKYDKKAQRCTVGTKAQSILHPIVE